jgi:hypothetical protein
MRPSSGCPQVPAAPERPGVGDALRGYQGVAFDAECMRVEMLYHLGGLSMQPSCMRPSSGCPQFPVALSGLGLVMLLGSIRGWPLLRTACGWTCGTISDQEQRECVTTYVVELREKTPSSCPLFPHKLWMVIMRTTLATWLTSKGCSSTIW